MSDEPNIFYLDHGDYVVCFIRGKEVFTTKSKGYDALYSVYNYFLNEFSGVSFEELDRMKPMMEEICCSQ